MLIFNVLLQLTARHKASVADSRLLSFRRRFSFMVGLAFIIICVLHCRLMFDLSDKAFERKLRGLHLLLFGRAVPCLPVLREFRRFLADEIAQLASESNGVQRLVTSQLSACVEDFVAARMSALQLRI